MRFEGTLKEWHAERGFGYIAPQEGGQYVFVHISAFPGDAAPPVEDERLSFEIVSSGEGRKQAARVQRLPQRGMQPRAWLAPPPPRARQLAKRRRVNRAFGVALLLVLGVGLASLLKPAAVGEAGERLAAMGTAAHR